MACDIDALLEEAKCFTGLDQGLRQVVIAQLLCDVSSSAGSGTFSGSGSPEGVVTASPGATYYDTAGAGFWVKETGTGNTGWTQLIS